MASCIGWDIGGAHLKAARTENGRIVAVVQLPCPLWLGVDRLRTAFAEALAQLGAADAHAATMTGELADVFPSRMNGVLAIAAAAAASVAPAPLRIYAGPQGFVSLAEVGPQADAIASANWHATGALLAHVVPNALLMDMGSTTTDLVPMLNGNVASAGYTDAQRLAHGELVYTGLTRGFLMSVADRAPFGGVWTPLACEHFATTADVYRILGELPEGVDQMPTADGRDKSVPASTARLARMVGRDAADAADDAWRGLAAWFAEAQLRRIEDAARLLLSRIVLPEQAPVIGAGAGLHVAARLAARLGRPFVVGADLLPEAAGAPEPLAALVGQCAPAAAVAVLASR